MLAAGAASEVLASSAAVSSADGTVQFVNTAQGYAMSLPVAWEKKDKMGADVIFEDPTRRLVLAGLPGNLNTSLQACISS